MALEGRFERQLFLNEGGNTLVALMDKRNAEFGCDGETT